MDEILGLAQETQPAEIKRNFATIGAVYADGVTLIFDGETDPTEKHYLCNADVLFSAGDRVRIIEDSGTYIVEYVVGTPKQEDKLIAYGVQNRSYADGYLTFSSGTDGNAGDFYVGKNDGSRTRPRAYSVVNAGSGMGSNSGYDLNFRTTSTSAASPVFQVYFRGSWHTISTTS